MKPWKLATILGVGWLVLTIVAAILHTEILVRDLTPEQDEAISYAYGRAAGFGAVIVAALAYVYQKRR